MYIQIIIFIHSFLCVCICVSGGSLSALAGKGKPFGSVPSVTWVSVSQQASVLPTPSHVACSTS